MGGSNSNNRGGGSQSRNQDVACDELKFNTQLSSPKEEVLVLLEVGLLLEIELSPSKTTCVVIYKSKIAGTIIHLNLKQLINCIIAGNTFYARVRSVDGAKCAITVLHESLA
ncbi:hypothetical protein [Mucilaginibacter dorajii]|uniref:Uncharacterized protein n=1 Tax=Mucilaginibacter dorajii TaxID=692994 RepID=A0ABP7PMK1_9SPHI|nr:hypothetical protein [Mucilaginibacter dorajii]MCS3733721.1 hypothetical protein [Mucilaginibacter dorajii]